MVTSAVLKRVVRVGSVPAAILMCALLVWQASYSAFSDTTENPGNSWNAGSVTISDDDSNAAMFTVNNAKPGGTTTKCIAVTYTGSLNAAVRLYGAAYNQTNNLGQHLTMTVEEGTGATFSSCAGFTGSQIFSGTLDSFATSRTNFANGAGSWAPAGGSNQTRAYRFTVTLSPSAPDSVQGGSAGIDFVWEAQSS